MIMGNFVFENLRLYSNRKDPAAKEIGVRDWPCR